MKLFLTTAVALLALAPFLLAEENSLAEAEKVSHTLSDAYVAAFNKGDAKTLSAMYADDVQYTSDGGVPVVGRAAMLTNLSKFFAKNKGAKLDLRVDSARFLTPDVLVTKGFATVNDDTTRYVCSYVKKEGSWLISELGETSLPSANAATTALGDLGWMVGSWKDNSPGVTVTSEVAWTHNHHFLRRSISVTRDGEPSIQATEVIGYDPLTGSLRSWMFDSEGGFGEGAWRREGNKWINSFTATSPDGSTSTSQHIITYLDNQKYTWESVNRQMDGAALPNLDKIEVVRTTGPEPPAGKP